MRIRTARTALALAGAALFCSAPAALADQPHGTPSIQAGSMVNCQSNGNLNFSPGVVPLPFPRQTDVQLTAQALSCAGTTPDNSPIVSSTMRAAFAAPLSCFYGGTSDPVSGTAIVEWRTADGMTLTSTMMLRVSGQLINSATIEGRVTSGLFAGEQVHGTVHLQLFKAAADCVSQAVLGGIRQSTADVTYNIAP